MTALGEYQALEPQVWLAGRLALMAALAATALLEQLQVRLRAAEASRWWASNGRDVANAFALSALWLALRLCGYSGPIALLAAAIIVVLASLLQSALAATRLPGWVSYLVMLALGAPVLIAPAAVHAGLRAAIEALF